MLLSLDRAITLALDHQILMLMIKIRSWSVHRASLAFPHFGNDVIWSSKYFITLENSEHFICCGLLKKAQIS